MSERQRRWVYRNRAFAYGGNGATGVLGEWQTFVHNQKRLGVDAPKLICIDIQPYGSTQVPERADILNIGGFSASVLNVVASYLGDDAGRFVAEVESIELYLDRQAPTCSFQCGWADPQRLRYAESPAGVHPAGPFLIRRRPWHPGTGVTAIGTDFAVTQLRPPFRGQNGREPKWEALRWLSYRHAA